MTTIGEQPMCDRIRAQVARVLHALDIAADRAEQKLKPGAAAEYVRQHPAATDLEIMKATGCSQTTARTARANQRGKA